MPVQKAITKIVPLLTALSLIILSCKRDNEMINPSGSASPYAATTKSSLQRSTAVQSFTCSGDGVDHFISLETALRMVRRYQQLTRREGEICNLFNRSGWVYAETFPAEVIAKIISQPGCCRFRIYNGIDDDNRLHLVMVGVTEKGADVLYCNGGTQGNGADKDSCDGTADLNLIAEMGLPCPEACGNTFVGP